MIRVYKYIDKNTQKWKRDYKSDRDKNDTKFL